ncbi:MAG: hypothetical protein ACXVP0_11980, partial [Bacteroidia bacterium]
MRITPTICILLLMLALCLSCKKYPENKFLQRVNPKTSIKGDWAFKAFYVDDIDSTYQQLQKCNPISLNPGTIVWHIESITNDTRYKSSFSHLYQKANDISCSCPKYYAFPDDISESISLAEKKNDLSIPYTHDPGYPVNYQDFFGKIYGAPLPDDNDYHWEIRKLNKTALALENVVKGKRY